MPREGHDGKHRRYLRDTGVFQSTCPARGTTLCDYIIPQIIRFQSTCPARGTTVLYDYIIPQIFRFQSTCPARGTTSFNERYFNDFTEFQSTCPARGTTVLPVPRPPMHRIFQSTCPARGTTRPRNYHKSHAMDFNPRAPRGARHTCVIQIVGVDYISIHVPREGHDPYTQSSRQHRAPFQSTCPARGTTACPLAISSASFLFQSTCPARGTTVKRGRHF